MVDTRELLASESGQGMTEYIIIVALIAVAAIGIISAFGKQVQEDFAAAGKALSGQGEKTAAFTGKVKNANMGNFAEKGR